MRSKLASLALTSMAFASAFAALAGKACARPAIVLDLVNLRSGPGLSFAPILAIPPQSIVETGKCRAQWCRVAYAGAQGYVAAAALSAVPLRSPDAARLPPVGAHVWTSEEPPLFDPYRSAGPWWTGPWRYEGASAQQWRYGFPGGQVDWWRGLGWRPGFGWF